MDDNNLIWLDLEMTGLDYDNDTIIEIATIVTDSQLNILAEGPVFAIYQADEVLDKMDAWCTKQHTKSGLVDRIRKSTTTMEEAEKATLDFVSQYVPVNKSPICGNSICSDRRFMHRQMPKLEKFFHYRHLDVSTLKELVRRWKPEVFKDFDKNSQHLALEDIKDSINELKYYREHFIKE